jgi:hypothetical protein
VVDQIRRAGGVLELETEKSIRIMLPRGMEDLTEVLRDSKVELMDLLRREGGRIANFPHCPRCASYALYREGNVGLYECMTCGCWEIEESVARRLV